MRELDIRPIIELTQQAGQAIMPYFSGEKHIRSIDPETETKEDGSPVTLADMAAHRVINAGLQTLSDLPILSEEALAMPYETRRHWTRFWLFDPLDGTREFLAGRPEFTINIALIEETRPILGVIHAPILGVTYLAQEGQGAFRKDHAGITHIEVAQTLGPTIRVLVSRSHDTWDKIAKETNLPCTWVQAGSALKFGRLAEGQGDVYPRRGPTMEWDTAAGQCIVTEAGARMMDWQGKPFLYNKEDLTNPGFFVGTLAALDAGFFDVFANLLKKQS